MTTLRGGVWLLVLLLPVVESLWLRPAAVTVATVTPPTLNGSAPGLGRGEGPELDLADFPLEWADNASSFNGSSFVNRSGAALVLADLPFEWVDNASSFNGSSFVNRSGGAPVLADLPFEWVGNASSFNGSSFVNRSGGAPVPPAPATAGASWLDGPCGSPPTAPGWRGALCRVALDVASEVKVAEGDWTTMPGMWCALLRPLCALLLSLAIHRRSAGPWPDPSCAGGAGVPPPVGFAQPALFALAAVLALLPGGGPAWAAAQFPLLFAALGYVVCSTRAPVAELIPPLLACYAVALGTWLVLEGGGVAQLPAKLLPLQFLSSAPLEGASLAAAGFACCAICVLLTSTLRSITQGSGASAVIYLWLWCLVGGVAVDFDSALPSAMGGHALLSLPVRLQIPAFACGMVAAYWRRPSRSEQAAGLVAALCYAALPLVLAPPGAVLHSMYHGSALLLQLPIVWAVVPLLSLGGGGAAARSLGAGDLEGPECAILRVSFSGILACASLQGGKTFLGAWVGEGRLASSAPVQCSLLLCLLALTAVTSYELAREGPKKLRLCIIDGLVTENVVFQVLASLAFLFAAVPLGLNLYGQLRWPATLRRPIASASDLLEKMHRLDESPVLVFRFCTRGNNPSLVKLNVELAHEALVDSGVGEGSWRLEVVTDHAIGLESALPGVPVKETVVPAEYECPRGGKFKARALHWAVLHSELRPRPTDWIVHLDEETRFDCHTVCAILNHCVEQNMRVKAHRKCGEVVFPDCGQGVILYNTNGVPLEAHLTALADVARVGDDLGKFRFCSEVLQFPAIGMHGSFAVINQAVETAVGFDHGKAGSITEDSYFACVANAEFRVGIRWIDAFMFEQSPFGPLDLIHQRARWFHGMHYCTVFADNDLPIRTNFIISCFMICWGSQFSILLVKLLYQLGCGHQGMLGLLFRHFVTEIFYLNYVLGFVVNFSPYREGAGRWLCLFIMSVTLLFPVSLLELAGVLRGMYLVASNANEFYIVQKEATPQNGHAKWSDTEETTAPSSSSESSPRGAHAGTNGADARADAHTDPGTNAGDETP